MAGSGWCRARQGWSRRNAVPLPQGNMDQERLKKQQELAAAALYQQLQHQQFLQLVSRYGGPGRDCLWGQALAMWLAPQHLGASLQPPAPAVCPPGKGSPGGADAAAAAAAHRVPAAAPSSQTPQVCGLVFVSSHLCVAVCVSEPSGCVQGEMGQTVAVSRVLRIDLRREQNGL